MRFIVYYPCGSSFWLGKYYPNFSLAKLILHKLENGGIEFASQMVNTLNDAEFLERTSAKLEARDRFSEEWRIERSDEGRLSVSTNTVVADTPKEQAD